MQRDADKEQISFETGGMGAKSYIFVSVRKPACCGCCCQMVLVLARAVSSRLTRAQDTGDSAPFLVKPLPQILSDVDNAG